MRARQCETSRAVVERSGIPALRGMAGGAIRRRKSGPRCRVYRGRGLLPFRQVAAGVPAVGRRDRQSVVVVDMARSAGHVGVPIGQQETRRAVIEDRRGPGNRVVASRAVGHRKSRARRGVHRIIGLLPGGQMASRIPAVRRRGRQIVIVVEVAGGARHIRMAIGQQKPGRAVIELRAQPTVKGDVARFAGSSKLRADVVRIRSLLKIPQMAGCASR